MSNGSRVITVYDSHGDLDYHGMYDFDRWVRVGFWRIRYYYIANRDIWGELYEDANMLCYVFYID